MFVLGFTILIVMVFIAGIMWERRGYKVVKEVKNNG